MRRDWPMRFASFDSSHQLRVSQCLGLDLLLGEDGETWPRGRSFVVLPVVLTLHHRTKEALLAMVHAFRWVRYMYDPPLFKHFNYCYFPYSSLIFSHQFDMSDQLSDSLNIARRPKFEFFDGECKNDIALLAPEWFGLPDTRKDKTRAQWFTKNFDAFRSKHEHKFHPEDRRLLESVSCCILRACPKYLPYIL